MTTTIVKMEAALALPRLVDEDLIRKSLIDAIEKVEKIKHNEDGGWFGFNSTAQTFLLHAEQHLNDELDALLRGEYFKFQTRQIERGKEREAGSCV